jgi:putative RecB family exonuclease
MDKNTEFHLSFSRIAVYENCPMRYKFIYVDKLSTIPRSYFSFGSTIHKVLEIFYHPEKNFIKKKRPPLEYLMELLDEHWISEGYKGSEEERARKEAAEILKKIYRENIFGFSPAYEVEKNFSFNLSNFKVIGRIDRIDKIGDYYKIIDYKTNRILPRFFKEIDLLQPIIYYIAGKEALHLPNIKTVSLLFVRYNKEISFNLTDNLIEKGKEKIVQTGQKILNNEFAPKVGKNCSTCEFRDICPAFKENELSETSLKSHS